MRCWLGVCVLAVSCFTEDGTPTPGGVDDSGSGTSVGASSTNDSVTTGPTATATLGTTGDGTTEPGTTAIDDSGTAESASSDPTMVMCSAVEVEIPPIPEGWQGVGVVHPTDGPGGPPCMGEQLADGFVAGVPTSCACTCSGAPSQLCDITLGAGETCPVDPVSAVGDDCEPTLGDALLFEVDGSVCQPEATLDPAGRGAQGGLACRLPQPEGPCVMVPAGAQGPCIFGSPMKCPDDWPNAIEISNSACPKCDNGCDTTDYCASVIATPWSGNSCNGVSDVPLGPGVCDGRPGSSSVGFIIGGLVSCESVAAQLTVTQLCCL